MATKTPAQLYEEFFVPGMFLQCCRELLDAVPPRPGERVLDVAAGSGVVAREVAPLVGPEGRVAGVELRPGMVAVASSLPAPAGAPIEWHEGDAVALAFPDASFDLVLCQQGLQFSPDQEKAVSEMHRVLSPGGRVGVAVWQDLERQGLFAELTEVEARHLAVVGMTYEDIALPFLLGDPEWLGGLLEEAGLRDVRVETRVFEARFAGADTFVENVEFVYAGIVPEFVEDPASFAAFVEAVSSEMRDVVERYRDGDDVVFAMHVNIAAATA